MPDQDAPVRRFAVLIDGDNANPDLLGSMMDEIGGHGTGAVRRIYGDWASGRLNNWKDALHEHAFQAVQQHSLARGKNSTDSRLIIEAMDLLHLMPIDAFAIISSDSDYTGLAKRLRESGKFVLGIGERKTPEPFVRACDKFVYTDLLAGAKAGRRKASPAATGEPKAAKATTAAAASPDGVLELLTEAIENVQGEDGYANLSQIRAWLQQRDPGFDPRAYGKRQLSQLFDKQRFEFRRDSMHWVRVRD